MGCTDSWLKFIFDDCTVSGNNSRFSFMEMMLNLEKLLAARPNRRFKR